MNLHTKDADAVMQIEENRYVVPLTSYVSATTARHRAVQVGRWICKDKYIYSSLPPMVDEENLKSQSIIKEGKQLGDEVYVGLWQSDNKEMTVKN